MSAEDKFNAKLKIENKQAIHNIRKKFFDYIEKYLGFILFLFVIIAITFLIYNAYVFFKNPENNEFQRGILTNIWIFIIGVITRWIKFENKKNPEE